MADIQQEVVKAEQGVNIAELAANARVKEANGEAEAIRVTGQAKAEAYHAGVIALGSQGYTALQMMQVIGDRNVRVVPDVSVSGSSGGGLMDGLLAMLVHNQISNASESSPQITKQDTQKTTAKLPETPKTSGKTSPTQSSSLKDNPMPDFNLDDFNFEQKG
jgi:uncharacterized membrane protein YqiK